MSDAIKHSSIYEGVVTHHRLHPRDHRFSYRVAMVYLDLDELDAVFARSPLWSLERWNLVCFRRRDYLSLGDPAQGLADAVRARIRRATGTEHKGPIRMLTNLRYFGFIINPITCYYCFDAEEKLQYIVAEVTNTPWRERHAYVLPMASGRGTADFPKQLHVSPFMAMDMDYHWRSSVPAEQLAIHMENHVRGKRQFTAGLRLRRQPLTAGSMWRLLWAYPLMTVQVAAGIYWQALNLWWKGVPFVPHPRKKTETRSRRAEL